MSLRSLGLASLLLASNVAFSSEPLSGWYAGLIAGGTITPSINFLLPGFTPYSNIPSKLSYGIGGNGGFQLGYRCDQLRFEGEFDFNYSPYNKLNIGGLIIRKSSNINILRFKGSTQFFGAFANAYYELFAAENDISFVPYVGLGIGYAKIKQSFTIYTPAISTPAFPLLYVPSVAISDSGSKSAPLGQAIIGINYFFDDVTSLGLDGRYITSRQIRDFGNERMVAETINLVLNFTFDQPNN